MNNREAVSVIENSVRGVSKDLAVPRRYVLKVLRDNAKMLISQKLLDRTLTQEENLYTQISCIELERIEIKKCPIIEFRMCRVVMRSVEPLPTPIYSRLGSSIREVVSVDGLFDFTIVSPQQYRRNKKRQHTLSNIIYTYIDSDNYLWVLDKEIFAVELKMITLESEKVTDCEKDDCKNNWEGVFTCPDKLLTAVISQATEFILRTYKSIPADPNPNTIENV